MKKLLTITTLALLSSSTLVLANSGPAPMPSSPAPAPAPMAKKGSAFSGMLVGGQLGYVAGSGRYTETEVRAPLRTARTDVGGSGFLGGANVSYNMQFNKALVGLEVAYNFTGLKGRKNSIPLGGNTLLETEMKQKNAWEVTARFGVMPADNVLTYMKAGVAFSKWNAGTVNVLVGSGTASKNLTGFVVGAGADVALGERFSVGAEYSFTQYGSFNYNMSPAIVNRIATVKPHTNSFMLHAKFKIF